ncbi:MAG TPA: recombination-associated protein RdgC [Candidatus Limnocylindria bacterium]|nr:recombination-associated protein RdgC [Candidatus Limnocylindria bacterium]
MGLLAPTSSILRFTAEPPARIDREAVAAAVNRHRFRELNGDGSQQTSGWIGIHDPLAAELSPADLFFQHYLAVGFRFDRRAVPAVLLRLERRRLEEERRRERGVPRLGAAARREIKNEVTDRLLARALPVPRLYDCLWNLETGRVYLTGTQRAARDAFAELFRRTFGVEPQPLIPYFAAAEAGLPALALETLRAAEPSSIMGAGSVPRLPLGEPAHPAADEPDGDDPGDGAEAEEWRS